MLGSLIAGLMGAAGTVTKGAGEALSMGGKDTPILQAAGQAVAGVGEALSSAGEGMGNAISGMKFELPGVDLGALGRGMQGLTSALSPGTPEVSQSLSRGVAIEPELKTAFCASVTDLGNLSPAACGGQSSRDGAGIGV